MSDRTSCARTSCDQPARFGVDVYCSDDCRDVSARLRELPGLGGGGSMHQSRGAAVEFARGLSWLDARAEEAT